MFEQVLNWRQYHFNPHAVPLFLVSTIIFWIGLFILLQAGKALRNISFFLLCLSFSIWLFSMGLVYLANNAQSALIIYKYLTFFGVAGIMPSGYFFSVVSSAEPLKKRRRSVCGVFLLAYIFYFFTLFSDNFITSPRLYYWGYYPRYEPLSGLFIVYFLAVFAGLQANLWRSYRAERVAIRKTQLRTFFICFMIAFTASGDFIAKYRNIPVYPYGYISMFIFTCLLAYSIIRYKAFDIETVIHKTLLWMFSFFLILLPVFFIYERLRPFVEGTQILQLLFWMISFFLFTLYLRLVQPRIDHFFQRRRSNLLDIAARFTDDLVHLKELGRLAQRIEAALVEAFYPRRIDIFIRDERHGFVRPENAAGERQPSHYRGQDAFLSWLTGNDLVVYRDFIDIDPRFEAIRETAKEYLNNAKTVVVIPFVLDGSLLGFIHLDRKANLRRYTAMDLKFLNTLQRQATIAIANSLLYKDIERQVRQRTGELVEVQKQLVQADKLATVGTLAGGVAHEINNPLAVILTNVQMLLMGNDGLDGESRESLELIEEATKRCRTIVRNMMAFAKKPLETVKFSEVNVLAALKNVVAFVGYQLEQENIRLRIAAQEKDYTIIGNQNELEQVFTNIILNARDAIKQIKTGGNIDISLSGDNDTVRVIVRDEGTGISRQNLSKIFDPFFTTKDVGKGTGLGLSICQGIVESHKGVITAESQEQKGSVFTIQLPKAKREALVNAG